jgi:hypothetical protein
LTKELKENCIIWGGIKAYDYHKEKL